MLKMHVNKRVSQASSITFYKEKNGIFAITYSYHI